MPTLSVVIPTYNESNNVVSSIARAALESDIEIVVVGDPQATRLRRSVGTTVRMQSDVPLEGTEDWRPAWQVLSNEMPPSEAIDTVIDRPGIILLWPDQIRRLAEDLGGLDAAWTWLERRSSKADRPVAAILEDTESAGRTLRIVGPQRWSVKRLTDLVVVSLGEIGEIDPSVGSTDFECGTATAKSSAPAAGRQESDAQDAGVGKMERDLDEARRRLTVEFQAERPDLFDGSGRPRKGALERVVQDRTGKKKLSRADILDLLRKKSN